MKPILFNTEMVRAILDGRKTQTRRLIKPQPKSRLAYCYAGSNCRTWGYPTATAHEFWGADFELPRGLSESEKEHRWKPPCDADDILWVRETWQRLFDYGDGYVYRADYDDDEALRIDRVYIAWRPSIHMPREAARLFLLVKKVRIERLQDITAGDVLAEGIKDPYDYQAPKWYEMHKDLLNCAERAAFAGLWETTVKQADLPRYGWDVNPWVWVIEFERIDRP